MTINKQDAERIINTANYGLHLLRAMEVFPWDLFTKEGRDKFFSEMSGDLPAVIESKSATENQREEARLLLTTCQRKQEEYLNQPQ